MRFAYFGSDLFHQCLQSLIDQGHHLVKLFTWRPRNHYDDSSRVMAIARQLQVAIDLRPPTSKALKALHKQNCQLLVSAGYTHKIPFESSEIPYGINIHPSLLPSGRGPWPLSWVILKNLPQTGVSLHKLSEQWDQGDILLQKAIAVQPWETVETLRFKSETVAVSLLSKFIQQPFECWSEATTQTEGSYWPKTTQEQRRINFNDNVEMISRTVRAYGKYLSYAKIQDKWIFVAEVQVWKEAHAYLPGTILNQFNNCYFIAAKDGVVCIKAHAKTAQGVLI